MRLSDLKGRRVAVWGAGDEGASALRCLCAAFPMQPVTVLNDAPLSAEAAARLPRDGQLTFVFGGAVADALMRAEIVIKSPGISLYRPEILQAQNAGVKFTSTTNLWFAEPRRGPVIAITGTKGKSTTAALLAHLWRSLGSRIALAGNMRVPLLDFLPENMDYDGWVLELSSYQCAILDAAPDVAVLLNLFPEHKDWHGTHARYYQDKLRLLALAPPAARVLNAQDPISRELTAAWKDAAFYNHPDGYHVRDAALFFGARRVLDLAATPLRGIHNLTNLCAALTALRAVGVDGEAALSHLPTFRNLPHRIEELGMRDGRLYVNDSISTIPEAAMNAVRCYPERPLAILLGGKDRGQDYAALAAFLLARPQTVAVCMYETGPRIATALREAQLPKSDLQILEARDLEDAVRQAGQAVPVGGVILLSPAASSYDAFKDYEARGEAFVRLAGVSR